MKETKVVSANPTEDAFRLGVKAGIEGEAALPVINYAIRILEKKRQELARLHGAEYRPVSKQGHQLLDEN